MLKIKRADTTELHRQVMAELAPQMKRRASAQREPIPQTEEVPVWRETQRRASRIRLPLFAGFLLGLILIVLGIQVMRWAEGVSAHWHGGDGGVVTLDADVGHGAGASHFIAFYRSDYVVVVEVSPDYKSARTYALPVKVTGDTPYMKHLGTLNRDGKRDLVITLSLGIPIVLYNTGDAFSTTLP
jgi:hypothetical protein